jgi:RNA polymerase sigma factor (sigma-70 family)
VCRSVVRDRHDAEDAFQATFLILVRKAGTLRVGETVGPWLHVVAYRAALSLRAATARRREVERSAAVMLGKAVEPTVGDPDAVPASEIRAAIHAEVMMLPEAFRAVVVLCDLEGASYVEAAGRLKIPLGTVQSRLARARRRLRRNLRLREIHPADGRDSCGASDAPLCDSLTDGSPPASLVGRVGRLGVVIASDPASLTRGVAGSVQALIRGGLRSMRLGTLRRFAVISAGALLVGGAVLYAEARSGQARDPVKTVAPKGTSRDEPKRPVEIPAPRGLRVAAGRGKALMYMLDRERNRISRRQAGRVVKFQEAPRAIRWAVVTGLIDHGRIPQELIEAGRKRLPDAESIYLRVELQRRMLQNDGTWSDWAMVDADANLEILDNLPEVEAEKVPERYRVGTLVDPLPHLTEGKWVGVDIEEFLPTGNEGRKDPPAVDLLHLGPQRNLPPVLMIRAIDFTVETSQTYRYRARVVLFNPRFIPGGPDRRKVLDGPWSEASQAITIPAP